MDIYVYTHTRMDIYIYTHAHGCASRDTLHAIQAIQEATHRPPSASEGKTPSSRGSSAGGKDGGVRLRPVSAARRGGSVAEAEAAMAKVHGCCHV